MAHIQRGVAELKSDTRQIKTDLAEQRADMRQMLERTQHLATKAELYRSGIALAIFPLGIATAIAAYAPKLRDIVGTAPRP